eukprot:scaffold7326_cov39-Prasinocladus_malaysianus.AAC.1
MHPNENGIVGGTLTNLRCSSLDLTLGSLAYQPKNERVRSTGQGLRVEPVFLFHVSAALALDGSHLCPVPAFLFLDLIRPCPGGQDSYVPVELCPQSIHA